MRTPRDGSRRNAPGAFDLVDTGFEMAEIDAILLDEDEDSPHFVNVWTIPPNNSSPVCNCLSERLTARIGGAIPASRQALDCAAVLDEWTELVGELLYTIQVLHDPDCIVLGGGVSRAPNIAMSAQFGLSRRRLMASIRSRESFHDCRMIGLRARSCLSS